MEDSRHIEGGAAGGTSEVELKVSATGCAPAAPRDAIPLAEEFFFAEADAQGMCSASFYAFNTVITLQAFGESAPCRQAFETCRDACRTFEREFSRTLAHSDITRLNTAGSAWVEISPRTYDLLQKSLHYCEQSGGVFDITMGAAVRLWDFHSGVVPDSAALREALAHVNWRCVELRVEEAPCANRERHFARLTDPMACVDVGGTAKGWIADALGDSLREAGLASFVVNLGGNVLVGDPKPNGQPWRIGLQDPRHKREENAPVLGAVECATVSAVTSGVYERSFTRNGVTYHHILDPKTGHPAQTDVAGVTVVARTSMDAEGYSTTLLALGREAGAAFAKAHPEIAAAYFVDAEGAVYQA